MGGAMRTVEATLNYLGPMAVPPVFNPLDQTKNTLVLEPHRVRIIDARSIADPPDLEREGFALAKCGTAVTDFRDAEQVNRTYLAEIAKLIKTLTGAQEVRASPGPVARYVDRSNEAKAAGTAPAARFAHTDYTDKSALDHFLPQVMAREESQRYRRISVYQTWRALSGPAQDVPLALVDSRSVQPADMVTALTVLGDEYGGLGQSFEYSMGRFNPRHRWHYFPNIQADEILVFKGYEFDPARPARVLHTAFTDATVPPGTPPRASIEARAFAFFEN
jgi:hypothetical protein